MGITMRICVENITKEARGKEDTTWINLPLLRSVEEALENIASNEGPWEYEIIAVECDVNIQIDADTTVTECNRIAERLAGLRGIEIDAINAYLEAVDDDIKEAIETIREGNYDFYKAITLTDLMRESYFDLEKDRRNNGYYESTYGVLHLF